MSQIGQDSLDVPDGTVHSKKVDIPELIAQKPLLSRTTTDLDTNPVLSDLQVPTPIGIDILETSEEDDEAHSFSMPLPDSGIVPGQISESEPEMGAPTISAISTDEDIASPIQNKEDNAENCDIVHPSLEREDQPKSLHFALGNSARMKRSSIYESKSTVTAIPIRAPSQSNRNIHSNFHTDRDDAMSMKSVSSSLTASFSRSFLFGFYDKKAKKETKNKNVLAREYWMKDESAKECFTCAKPFTTFRRKHHCRICGQIFCSNCTSLISGESFGYSGRMRICGKCYEHSLNYEDSSEEYTDDENKTYDQISSRHLEQDTNQLYDDDAQSILTTNADSKHYLNTPEPPPRMAIPATKQGESLEISFHNGNGFHAFRKSRPRRGTHDRYTIHDLDMLSPIPQEFSEGTHLADRPTQSSKGPQRANLRQSFASYLGHKGGNTLLPDNVPKTSVMKTLASNNFKFEFNYDMKNFHNYLNKERQGSSYHEPILLSNLSKQDSTAKFLELGSESEDGSEDEASMSLYTALNDSNKGDKNRTRGLRSTTNSTQRAQASLQRMRQRRKSKSRWASKDLGGKGDFNFLNLSAPNLVTVVSNDLNFPKQEPATFKQKSKLDSNSKDIRKSSSPYALWRRLSIEKRDELNEVSKLHINALLKQALEDQGIVSSDEWHPIFDKMIHQIQAINLDARKSGDIDFKQQHVKIKRLPGGKVLDSEIINGLLYSKGLPLKSMPRQVSNPRILLVMFPLEYQKHNHHIISLESVMAQETEYLKKLVLRLLSLNPDVVLVGANVSGYALQLFHEAGVVVQYNIKPQIIERISRFTACDIVITMDKLSNNIKLAVCDRFEVRTYIYDNISKNYTFITGCKAQAGVTLLLRGSTADYLRKVKDVSEFIVYAVFSMKLESLFLNDNFLQPNIELYRLQFERKTIKENMTGYFSEFLEKFKGRFLSVSPMVDFPIPFLLQKARSTEIKYNEKQALLKSLETASNVIDYRESVDISKIQLETALTQRDIKYLIKFLNESEVNELKISFDKYKKQWEIYHALSQNMLATGPHQSISVLYSVISKKTTTPCIGPEIVTIDFFWENDISIGQFIENVVATAFRPCVEGCGELMIDHYRSYANGSGKVDVIVERLHSKLPMVKNMIFTWSYCKKCGLSSPTLQLSDRSWSYSLGKYLELMFWSQSGSLSGIANCPHEVSKDHLKYFSLNDIVIRMEYSPIDVHELITPSNIISWKPHIDIKLKVELYYQTLEKIDAFYGSVLERLNKLKFDSISEAKMEAAKDRIEQLKINANEEKTVLLSAVEEVYTETRGNEHLKLNSTIRALHDNAAGWDAEFIEFEKSYLPTEKDIARITALQLKKMFVDSGEISTDSAEKELKDSFPEKDDKEKASKKEFTSEVQTKVAIPSSLPRRPVLTSSLSVPVLDKSTGHRTADDQNSFMDARRNSRSSYSNDVIHTRKLSVNSNNSGTTQQSKDHNSDSKVGQLASFFDQIHFDALSREFELQREIERLQVNKNKYKAIRAKSLKPIVEIYKNVQDAVQEPINVDKNGRVLPNTQSKLENTQLFSLPPQTLNKGLENELEESINRWSEKVLQTQTKQQGNDLATKASNEPLPPITTITTANKDGTKPDTEQLVMPSQKTSLLTTLSNFWADRSASFWKPLAYPTSPTEHIFMDNDVIIREDEPTSLVAFCLSSNDYLKKVHAMLKKTIESSDVESSNLTHDGASEHTGSKDFLSEHILNDNVISASDENLESIMTKKTGMHLRYQFQDANTIMSCKIFFFEQFDAFRKKCGCGDEKFIQSLSRCVKWDSTGGKSGSAFLKTLDDRFVIKELSHSELDAFVKFASSYFEYMSQALFHELPTALAKILGFYQIQIKNSVSGKSFKIDVIIMENLFYEKKTSRIFDLKGSMRNRHVEQTGRENEVLLDENMVEYIYESPIFVREYDKKLLRASLWNDTLFLAKMNVMDYSLVVGVDNDSHSLTVGIIDCIRTFTWDKKLESWVKEKGLVGGNSKEPTVVTPRQYKNRFREAMERYILMVPDPWYQETGN